VIALKELLRRLFSLLFYYYYKEYYSCLLFLPCSCSGQVTGDNAKGAIVTIAGGNILDET
jgi:hypothetical protein